jgi:hypothetical protein
VRPIVLFVGGNYYPSGGWYDVWAFFETEEQALITMYQFAELDKFVEYPPKLDGDWWHIVDLRKGKVINRGRLEWEDFIKQEVVDGKQIWAKLAAKIEFEDLGFLDKEAV